jgi:hypothetical protein
LFARGRGTPLLDARGVELGHVLLRSL